MNIPEGWPTEEMIAEVEGLEYDFTPGGSETVTGCVGEEMAREIFTKMLAAAPTPPAQEDDNWINADEVNALVRQLDVLLNGEEGAARQSSLCDIVAQVAKMKAQEDEPVAYQYRAPDIAQNWNKCSQREYELFFSKQIGYECRKLYTRPDDKLRKAADEAIEVLQWYGEERMVNELRAALEGNPTPSNTDKPCPD